MTTQDLLGQDVLLLECSMRDPTMAFEDYTPECDFSVSDETVLQNLISPPPVLMYAGFRYLTGDTRQRKPPLDTVQYYWPIAEFRNHLVKHVHPMYHHEWIEARRRLISRNSQAKRRKSRK